ncbi:MAG: DedA family protein [Planctomycetes bacterium]|nr:DedA family protein [Planctomycetota bacterium]
MVDFTWLLEFFENSPYLGVAVIFVLCGLGLPLPEEITLVAAGYICFKELAEWPRMMAVCALAILAGDLIPFFLGRVFGPRLLRLRPMRLLFHKRRLEKFDKWFRRRGDLVIFFARFVPGIRVVAFFTAGTMKMGLVRFVLLDLLGVVLVVPLFVYIGVHFGSVIDLAIARIKQVERGILLATLAGVALALAWWWWRRRRRRARMQRPPDTFVGPTIEPTTVDLAPPEAGAPAVPPPQAQPAPGPGPRGPDSR